MPRYLIERNFGPVTDEEIGEAVSTSKRMAAE